MMFIYFLTSSLHATTPTEQWSFKGYLEARTTWSNSNQSQWSAVQRVRPDIKYFLTDNITVRLAVNAQLNQGRFIEGELYRSLQEKYNNSALPGLDGETPTFENIVSDCNWTIEPKRTINDPFDVVTIPRVHMDFNAETLDLRVGRQAINWGSALFFNPTDVFAQNLFAEPWQERRGINAIKLNADVGEEGWITALTAIDDTFETLSGGVKYGINQWHTDFNAIAAYDGNSVIGGIDLKGDVLLGWWVEAAYRLNQFDALETGSILGSAGIDYTFDVADSFYVMTQITYDGTGEIPELYDWSALRNPDIMINDCDEHNIAIPKTAEMPRQTLGRWYGLSRFGLAFEDRWKIQLTTLFNLADGSGILFPTLEYKGDQISLNLGLNSAIGGHGEFNPPPEASEATGINLNALYPNIRAIGWLRWNL